MRRILGVATVLCMLVGGGEAFAGRGGRHGGHGGGGGGGVVVRDHRSGPPPAARPVMVREHRGGRPERVRVVNGRYVFPGGVVRVYKRPVYRHYYDRRVRPAIIVEQYDPVPGYVWVSGGWSWGGAEWVWTPGYWAVDGGYAEPAPPTATVQGGVSVSAGISIH